MHYIFLQTRVYNLIRLSNDSVRVRAVGDIKSYIKNDFFFLNINCYIIRSLYRAIKKRLSEYRRASGVLILISYNQSIRIVFFLTVQSNATKQ